MRRLHVLWILLFLATAPAEAQEKNGQKKDSTSDTTRNGILNGRISREIMDAVTRKVPEERGIRNVRSEEIFQPYEGKIIRKIIVRRVGFERSIYDSAKTIRNRVTKIANALHADTKESVIRNNLLFRSNRPLNPYLLADNERYLRDLDFILDSRIVVRPIEGEKDSVDVIVETRDVFSFGGRAKGKGINGFSAGLYDANLFGYGQRLQTDLLFERGRTPFVGFGMLFTKSSLGGSLVNLTAGYTELDNARSFGEENEYAYFLRFERPLVSPYSRMAGGIEFSRNWSKNVYASPDSLFRRYRYNAEDIWTGYNIGIKNNEHDRSRHFIALRYFRQNFQQRPSQEKEQQRRIYNDQEGFLGEITFYDQNFYKTNYIYGFGRTEDVPYGHTFNITAGVTEEVGLRRTYIGAYGIKRIVHKRGNFYDFEAGAGTFFNKGSTEDGVFYLNATYYSKLWQFKHARIRQLVGAGYAKAFDNNVRELLTLNNELVGFTADSLYGYKRLFLRTETTVFTDWQWLGFRCAPFLSLEGSLFQEKKRGNLWDDLFWGTTGGVRIRNENLIFGTIEFRAFYFPTTVPGVDPLSFKVTTNVRIKYSGSFVRAPDFVRYN